MYDCQLYHWVCIGVLDDEITAFYIDKLIYFKAWLYAISLVIYSSANL